MHPGAIAVGSAVPPCRALAGQAPRPVLHMHGLTLVTGNRKHFAALEEPT